MRISYDISALVEGGGLTGAGIEDAVVGLHAGLTSAGADVRLVRFDQAAGHFRQATWSDVPRPVRGRLGLCAAAHDASTHSVETCGMKPSDAVPRHAREKRRSLRTIALRGLGKGTEVEELRLAFRGLTTAAAHLASRTVVWARGRWRRRDPVAMPKPPSWMLEQVVPVPTRWHVSDSETCDVLIAAGTGWAYPGQIEAVAAAREQGVGIVQMIHDVIPTLQPQWCDASRTRIFTRWLRAVLMNSDQVLTFSEFTRREVERYCGETRLQLPSRIVVCGGAPVDEAAGDCDLPPRPVFVPSRPFFLCDAPLTSGDNHRFLHDVWAVLKATLSGDCPDLLCIGAPDPTRIALVREIRADRRVNGHVHELPMVARWEQRWYYANCEAVICPSRYEEVVQPVAKSLAAGRLCLTARSSAAVEGGGELPELFEPYDTHALANLVVRVLREREWVWARQQEIRRTFRTTTWHEIAAKTMAVLELPVPRRAEATIVAPFSPARGSVTMLPPLRASRAA